LYDATDNGECELERMYGLKNTMMMIKCVELPQKL